MSYVSIHFAAMTAALFFLYYFMPKRFQPYLLLAGSLYFYYRCSGILLIIMVAASVCAYLFGRLLYTNATAPYTEYLLYICNLILIVPLIFLKYIHVVSIGIPVGISFYTLQLIAYCCDIYHGKCEPETNFFHFLLFTSFFPQILQGPIPRYQVLKTTMFIPHEYEKATVTTGFSKILTGLLLKFLIADKAGVLVDTVFNSNELMPGCAYALAGIFYSFQLYADFLSCVCLAQGISLLFGIQLGENFKQPYCATSVKDFWHRWHMSLSTWLRDYIYIPLGGSRKGSFFTNLNILITFLISGIWHGVGLQYMFWGLLHGCYQIIGKYTCTLRNHLFTCIKCSKQIREMSQQFFTYILITIAWIIFRANSLTDGLFAVYSIIFRFDLSSFITQIYNDANVTFYGLALPEFILLILCILCLLIHDCRKNKGLTYNNLLISQNSIQQCIVAICILLFIAIFGTYGFGYDARTFIYGGF